MERFIDLRSDTVTVPAKEMYQAALRAPVGDDAFDDDPTVKRPEATTAITRRTDGSALKTPSVTDGLSP